MVRRPVIVTAGDEKFLELIRANVSQTRKFGYEPFVWDLGELGFGHKYTGYGSVVEKYDDSLPETAIVKVKGQNKTNRKSLGNFKPFCILEAMEKLHEDWEWMMWLDADAFIVKNIDEMFTGGHDAGITLRHSLSRKPSSRFLNSGVVVVKNSYGGWKFIERWCHEQSKPDCIVDQGGLHNVFYNWGMSLVPEQAGEVVSLQGIQIKCFPWKIYNQTFSRVKKLNSILHDDKAKILHMQKGYFPQTRHAKASLLEYLKSIKVTRTT
jgi:hypothetical protein